MSIAVFEFLEALDKDKVTKIIEMLSLNFEYKILFTELKKDNIIDFHLLISLLKHYNISFQLNDNLFCKLKELRDTINTEEKYKKKRDVTPSILTFIGLLKLLNNTVSNYKKYGVLYCYLKTCSDKELEWSVHCLINRKKILELIL